MSVKEYVVNGRNVKLERLKMKRCISLLFLFAFVAFGFAQTNLLPNGDLETYTPNYWAPTGDGATWAGEGYNDSEHSFQIVKAAPTISAVGWESENQADLYWNNAAADVAYNLGFWVKTQGVNTAPAADDEKIGVKYEFFSGGVSIGEKTMWIDQTAADMDWTEVTDGLLITPGMEPDEIYITAFMSNGATGTVWFDNISCGTDPWSMGVFNSDAEIPEGWMNWASGTDIGYANLDMGFVHGGTYSALLKEEDDLGDEMVFYSEPIPAEASTWYKVGVWAKRMNGLTNAEWLPTDVTDFKHNDRMNICFFSHAGDIYTSWTPTAGDRFVYFDERETEHDWTHYTFLYKTEEDATGLSVRARFNNTTKGSCWFDDFTVEEVELADNLLPNGDLETYTPNYWAPTGDGATWAGEGYNDSEHSFQIVKAAPTISAVGWESENQADLYWNNAAADVAYNLGFWVKTQGVNTAPATDDGKIGVKYEFFNSSASIGEKTIWIDQTAADMDWTEVTDGLLITPGMEPDEILITAFMGKDATGTVWFDNISCGTDPWSMGVFNSDAEIPEGWMNWASGTDTGYANLDNAFVHGGSYSVLLKEEDDLGDEMVFYSEPIPAEPSTWYQLSVWAKRLNGLTNAEWLASAATDFKHNDRMNFCFFSHAGDIYTSWTPTAGDRFFYFDERETEHDWTHYTVLYKTEEDATGLSVRARFNNTTKGSCWFDDFEVREADILQTAVEEWYIPEVTIPENFELLQNFPNPFNPSTQIGYVLEKDGIVELEVFNVMGRRIRTLVNEHRQAGMYKVIWDGRDESGNRVESGVYIYQLRTTNNVVTKRMVLIK